MIEFKKIFLKNCFAYKDLEFDFTSGINSINGTNGASKTSIYLALAQGLYNKNPKNTRVDDVSNYVTGQPYEITIFFTKDNDSYKVVNSRKTGNITVEVNGKNISMKTIPQNLELIREILEVPYETFTNMTYQSTDSTLDLVEESTDSARKNFINKLLKFNELDIKLAETKDKIKALKTEVKNNEKLVETLQASVLPLRACGEVFNEESIEAMVGIARSDLATITANHSVITSRLTKIEAQKAAKEAYVETLEKAGRIEKELSCFRSIFTSKENVSGKLESYTKTMTTQYAELVRITAELDSAKEPESICSRCGQSVASEDALTLYAARTKNLKDNYDKIQKLVDKLTPLVIQAADEVKKWEHKEKLEADLASLRDTKVTFEDISNIELTTLTNNKLLLDARLKEATDTLTDAQRRLSEVKEHNIKIRMTQKFNQEASDNNAKIKAKISKATKEILEANQRLDLLDNWARILGSQGYRVHKMNRFLKLLNSTMVKYSSIISSGKISCRFFITAEGRIDFSVTDADKKAPYSNWSKGEQARVKLSCLFSVLEILEVMGSASTNILFLDEVFSSLDAEGREGLFSVLNFLRGKEKCIYTISHHSITNDVAFDSKIEVCKKSGLSYIQQGE